MFRTLSASVLAIALLSANAYAMDCSQEFKVRLDRMMSKTSVPTVDMVETARFLVQGYDACMKGDQKSAKEFFEKGMKTGS
jgi:DNA-binding FadR family transcriptional regulator